MTSVTIPQNVKSIRVGAFSFCSSLTSITIPNSVTSIGSSAFWACSGLTSITIPNNVTSIDVNVFLDCSSLTSVTIPNSVKIIGNKAFKNCTGLTSITIPNSVTGIDGWAFAGCPELTDIYCFAEMVPKTESDAFQNSYIEYATLHVPEASLEKYKATMPWNSIQNIVSIESGGQLFDMTINVSNAFGKVTYGTTDIADGQQTFDVKEGSDVILTLTPNNGYEVSKVTVNGEDKTADVVDGKLTLSNVTADLTVNVSFGVAGDYATVIIGAAGVVTFCPAADVDFTSVGGVKAYIGSIFNRETGVLTMTRAYDVPAGTGLLIKGEPGTYEIPYKQSHSLVSNLLKGVTTETNLAATTGGYANYVLASGSNGTGFYRVPTEGTTLAAGRAYLSIPAETAASRSALRLAFDDEDEATGISASLTNSEERIENSAVYDLQGRRVEQPQPGLYIRNGKKVIIK